MNAFPITAYKNADGAIFINGRKQRSDDIQAVLVALWNGNQISEYNALQNYVQSIDPDAEMVRDIPDNKRYTVQCAVRFGNTTIVRLRCLAGFRSNIHNVSVEEGEITGWVLLPNVSNMISGNLIVREDSYVFSKATRAYIEGSNLAGCTITGSTIIKTQAIGCTIADSEVVEGDLIHSDIYKSSLRNAHCSASQISESSVVASEVKASNLFITYVSVSKVYFSALRSCTFSKAVVDKSRLNGHISQVVGQGDAVSIVDVTDDSTIQSMLKCVESADIIHKRVSAVSNMRDRLGAGKPRWEIDHSEDGSIVAQQEGTKKVIEV